MLYLQQVSLVCLITPSFCVDNGSVIHRIIGQGPIMPPDDPTGKLYDGDESLALKAVSEASWSQAAPSNDVYVRQDGLTEPAAAALTASAASDADAGVSAASSSHAEDAHPSHQHNEQQGDAPENNQDIFATSSLHADGGISVGANQSES